MDIFKDHKDIFGKPEEGVHKHTLFGLAIVDVVMTVIICIIIAIIGDFNITTTIIGGFIIGEFFHLLFGVDTRFLRLFKC